jgi:hypothetical protein
MILSMDGVAVECGHGAARMSPELGRPIGTGASKSTENDMDARLKQFETFFSLAKILLYLLFDGQFQNLISQYNRTPLP